MACLRQLAWRVEKPTVRPSSFSARLPIQPHEEQPRVVNCFERTADSGQDDGEPDDRILLQNVLEEIREFSKLFESQSWYTGVPSGVYTAAAICHVAPPQRRRARLSSVL